MMDAYEQYMRDDVLKLWPFVHGPNTAPRQRFASQCHPDSERYVHIHGRKGSDYAGLSFYHSPEPCENTVAVWDLLERRWVR